MLALTIESQDGRSIDIDVPPGSRMVDVCDDHVGAEPQVPFSCRSASCGTCRLALLEGAELFEPADDEELAVLEDFGDDPANHRLACQARFVPGRSGRVRVLILGE